jgi:uncharacterized protein YbjQ (UPF0145 family)
LLAGIRAVGAPAPPWRVDRQIGLCWGLVVRSVGFVKGFTGSIRSLRAGEVDEYTAVLDQARRHALDRLVEHAKAMGANAIAGVRFDSSEIGNNRARRHRRVPDHRSRRQWICRRCVP